MASRHGTVDLLGDAGLAAKDKGFPTSNRWPLDVCGCEEENQAPRGQPGSLRAAIGADIFPQPLGCWQLALQLTGSRGPAVTFGSGGWQLGSCWHPTAPHSTLRSPAGGAERPPRCSRSPSPWEREGGRWRRAPRPCPLLPPPLPACREWA